jgi:hypothetical protein
MGVDGEFCHILNATKLDVALDKRVPKLKMLRRGKLPTHIAEPIYENSAVVAGLEAFAPTSF